MKVLVTGAKGMLGQDLCPILEDEDYEVIETDINNMDITELNDVKQIIETEKPDIIIHCAAYTNVDNAEEEKALAEKINVNGTENIAKICGQNDILLIYISTDYVFDGKKGKPYTHKDSPNPINYYGETKYKGENIIKKYCQKYYIVRTSWLYGHHGKNFVETMISLSDKNEISIVNDQIGCPTWTVDLCNGILNLIEDEAEYGIYHICGSGKATWFEFAQEIFRNLGLNPNLIPCSTEEYPCIALRPKYSVMDNENICRRWESALKDYLNLR